MKEDDTRHAFHLKRRLYARFVKAHGKVASVSKNSISFFIVPSEGALRGGTGHVIQRGINARDDKEEADDQQGEDLEKAFHSDENVYPN